MYIKWKKEGVQHYFNKYHSVSQPYAILVTGSGQQLTRYNKKKISKQEIIHKNTNKLSKNTNKINIYYNFHSK